jgi:hypothetical protein
MTPENEDHRQKGEKKRDGQCDPVTCVHALG